jgi:outer membrane protein insertion porin family
VGLGLRYITPIGPIGFLYGFKLDPKDGESAGRLHFAMGYTF